MKAPDSLAALLELLLDRYLSLDPAGRSRLEPMHGRVIALEVIGLGVELYLVPGPAGVQVLTEHEGQPDCTLRGTPLALARMTSERERTDQLFSGGVEVTGDTDLGHSFGKLLASLDVDWEEKLAGLTGDLLAHQAGNLVRDTLAWVDRSSRTLLQQDLPEYLQEESHLLPTPREVDEFLAEVDRLRDDTERLELRVKRLRDRVAGSGKPPG